MRILVFAGLLLAAIANASDDMSPLPTEDCGGTAIVAASADHKRLPMACCTVTYHMEGASHFIPTLKPAPCPDGEPEQSLDLCAAVARSEASH